MSSTPSSTGRPRHRRRGRLGVGKIGIGSGCLLLYVEMLLLSDQGINCVLGVLFGRDLVLVLVPSSGGPPSGGPSSVFSSFK